MSCSFAVHAWNGVDFSSTANVLVTVSDQNDNPPIFLNKTYSGSIDEGSGRGSEIFDHQNKPLFVKAIDSDSGENSKITYTIVERSAKRYFEIDASSGKLSTRQVINFSFSIFVLIAMKETGNFNCAIEISYICVSFIFAIHNLITNFWLSFYIKTLLFISKLLPFMAESEVTQSIQNLLHEL